MKVIILGAGQVGYSIAHYLAQEDNDITIVDKSPEVLQKVSDKLDIQPVVGFASHPDILEQAGASEADLLIAVTASDEVNMIACEVAQSVFGMKMKIARVRHQSYLKPIFSDMFHPQRLAIDVTISPEVEVAKALSRSTEVSGAFDVITMAGGLIKIIGIRAQSGSQLINTPLRLLPSLLSQFDITLLTISRGDRVFFPGENDQILADDDLYFAVHADNVKNAMEAFGYYERSNRNFLIVGGGNIGYTFASELENNPDITVKIIERDRDRAEYVARKLKNTEVFKGDALDNEILAGANVAQCESIISVTNDDKVNILSALLAKQSGVNRAVALLNNMHYSSLVTSLGVDAVVSPRTITVSTILQHVRQGRVQSVYTLGDGYAEIVEAEARETSHIIGLSVDDITIRGSVIVCALLRDGIVYLLPHKMIISVNDQLVILSKSDAVKKVERLFSIRPSYL